MFNIEPQMAKKAYEEAKKRLDELEKKKAQLLSSGIRLPQIDEMIERQREEVNACAYYAFGSDYNY